MAVQSSVKIIKTIEAALSKKELFPPAVLFRDMLGMSNVQPDDCERLVKAQYELAKSKGNWNWVEGAQGWSQLFFYSSMDSC